MPLLPLDCPHQGCLLKNVGFEVVHSVPFAIGRRVRLGSWVVTAVCGSCKRPVLATISYRIENPGKDVGDANDPMNSNGNLGERYDVERCVPNPPKPRLVASLPPRVEAAYDEAERARSSGILTAAAVMFRKTMEIALTDLGAPPGRTLAARIKNAAESGLLPPSMLEWADRVRFHGNGAAHDEEPPSADEVEAAAEFTYFFLLYGFELPAKVEHARERAEARPA